MPRCIFCKKQYDFPRGVTVVKSSDGAIRHYCSSKCRKNSEMRRDNKKVNWIRKYKKTRAEEIAEFKAEEAESVEEGKEKAEIDKTKENIEEEPEKKSEEKKK